MQSSLSSPHRTPNIKLFPRITKDFLSIPNTIKTSHFLSRPNTILQLRCEYDGFSTQLRSPVSLNTTQKRFLSNKQKNETKNCTHILCSNSSNSLSAENKSVIRGFVEVLGEVISTAFPLWVALGCLIGLWKPNSFNWVRPQVSIWGLTVIMLGMGMTLTLDDLSGAFSMPKEVIAGFVLQYSVCFLPNFPFAYILNLLV